MGMSILLTTPAYLLILPALLFGWRRRVVAGAALAVLCTALAALAHFSQGWVQFGYRFSNDFAPFAIILVTLGIVEAARWRIGRVRGAAAGRPFGAHQPVGGPLGRGAGMVTEEAGGGPGRSGRLDR